MKTKTKPKPKVRKGKITVNVSRLARETGYSKSHISRVIRRIDNPSIECLTALSKVLGIDMTLLWTMIKKGNVRAWKNN